MSLPSNNRRYVNGTELIQGVDGLWRDKYNTIYGLPDAEAGSSDPVARCGVAPFVLPVSDPFTDACEIHDAAYSNPTYQNFHTRSEVDSKLEADLRLVAPTRLRRWLAPVLAGIAKVFGRFFWEIDGTR